MTVEKLQNKKVTIIVNKTFKLGDDFDYEVLKNELESTKLCDAEFLNDLIETYYSSWSDFRDVLEESDFNVMIHD